MLVVYLWNNPNWNIYVSAGGMVEKGLRMNYSQSVIQREESNSLNYSTHQSIRGLQWSLNASVGVTYVILQRLGNILNPAILISLTIINRLAYVQKTLMSLD